MVAAQRSGFSRRLAALANATDVRAGTDSATQKTPDLVRRKAVGYNPLLARCRVLAYIDFKDSSVNELILIDSVTSFSLHS